MHELKAFFEAYNESFTRDAATIARFYHEPCVNARTGVVRLNPNRSDTERFFSLVLGGYRAKGFTHGNIIHMATRTLGRNSALATVRWAFRGGAN
jgi:hypothetical protein